MRVTSWTVLAHINVGFLRYIEMDLGLGRHHATVGYLIFQLPWDDLKTALTKRKCWKLK